MFRFSITQFEERKNNWIIRLIHEWWVLHLPSRQKFIEYLILCVFWKQRGVYHIKRAFKGKLRFVINGKVFVFCWKIIYQAQLMSPERFFRDFIIVRPAITSLPIKREIREKTWNYLRLFSNQMFAIAPSCHWREHNSLERNRVSFFFSIICLGFLYPLESNHEVKSLNYIFDARPRRRKKKASIC